MSYEKEYRHCLENTNKRELVDKIIYDEKEFIKKDIEIYRLNKENKQLKDNWNKLKEYLENKIDKYSINLEYLSAERMTQIKNKMQELEKGDNNDKNNR